MGQISRLHADKLIIRVLRITFTIPVFAIVSFIIIVAQSKSIYLLPIVSLYEALALGGFFILLGSYLSPSEAERERVLQAQGKLGMYSVCQSHEFCSKLLIRYC